MRRRFVHPWLGYDDPGSIPKKSGEIFFHYDDFDRSSLTVEWNEFWRGVELPPDFGSHVVFDPIPNESAVWPDFVESVCGWTLISEKLRFIIEANTEGVEYQWIKPVFGDLEKCVESVNYMLINVLTHVTVSPSQCVNSEPSIFDWWALSEEDKMNHIPPVSEWDRLTRREKLRFDVLGSRNGLFRLSEFPLGLFASDSLNQAAIEQGVTGIYTYDG